MIGRVGVFLFTALCVSLLACSASRRHKVLDFVFDGVPPHVSSDADTSGAVTSSGDGRTRYEVPTTYEHPPHEEGMCDACHAVPEDGSYSGGTDLLLPANKLCFECHDDFEIESLRQEYNWVHGPVAAGECVACHGPHRTTYPSLLRQAPREEICGRCHKSESMSSITEHELSKTETCLDCHWPHFGPDRVAIIPDAMTHDSLAVETDAP